MHTNYMVSNFYFQRKHIFYYRRFLEKINIDFSLWVGIVWKESKKWLFFRSRYITIVSR